MDNSSRTSTFRKDDEVERILDLLESRLAPVELELVREVSESAWSPVFILGCARSGTTVLHQFLVGNIRSVYPTNLISRFYYAPYLGGLLQKLFTDLDSRGELLGDPDRAADAGFASDLGKTRGILSPNEFWYFWRKHFPINANGTIDAGNVQEHEARAFRNSIYALQNLFEAPFITKGMIANNCLDYIAGLFPGALFIYVSRDLFSNALSLYRARLSFFGTVDKWYSFRPLNGIDYRAFSPEEQVVRQVLDTNAEISASLQKVAENQVIRIDYESFCDEPAALLSRIKSLGVGLKIAASPSPARFKAAAGDADDEVARKIKAIAVRLQEAT